MSSSRAVRRVPTLVLLAALAVAGLRAGDRAREPLARARPVHDAAVLPASGSRSAAYYCVDGPSPEGSKESYHLVNTGDQVALVGITVMPDDAAPVRRRVEVEARSTLTVPRLDLTDAGGPAVIEPFSDEVAVEHQRLLGGMLVLGPCATNPSAKWHFAAGTTERGVEQWLYLFNPFPDDAVVDITFFTSSGLRRPEALQGMSVPRRSQVALAVHGAVRREARVAAVVTARVGRIVAEQSVVFGEESSFSGTTRSLGAVAPALEWYFADGRTREGARRLVAVANPGEIDTEVDVQVVPADDTVVEPLTLTVPREDVVVAQIGECGEEPPPGCLELPDGLSYSVVVSATTDEPVVAEELATWTDDETFTGASAALGTGRPAPRWYFARGLPANSMAVYLNLYNPGAEPATVEVAFVAGGATSSPEGLNALEVPAGSRTRLELSELLEQDAGVVVTASSPVVAERTVVRSRTINRTSGVAGR